MIDLMKIIGSDHFLEIVEFVKSNPAQNASTISKKLKIHIVTIQRCLDTLDKYQFVKTGEKHSLGRPSKIYSYQGGRFQVDFDGLLSEYEMRKKLIRETGNPGILYSFDVDKEIVNAVLVGGKTGKKIKLDEKEGRFLWAVPPPDSKGELIETIARNARIPVTDAVRFILDFSKYNIFEVFE
jgi:hypothetical protein